MKFCRRVCLAPVAVGLCAVHLAVPVWSQAPAAPSSDQAKPAPERKKQANPFESVPEAPAAPQAPQGTAPAPARNRNWRRPARRKPPRRNHPGRSSRPSSSAAPAAFPQDTLRAMIFTKKGDRYDEETLRRDFMALWNTGRFDDIRLEAEPGRTGLIMRFVLTERRVVRSIKYDGVKSVTVSEILDRFKERKVGLSVESQYDPNKVQRAAVVLKEFLAERGRQYADGGAGDPADPALFARGHLQSERRAEGEGGRDRYHGQQRLQRPRGAPGDEEPAADRHPALASSSRTFSPRPTTRPSSRRTRT